MKILRLILDNLKRGTLTAKFPEKQPVSPNYRGMVSIDSENAASAAASAPTVALPAPWKCIVRATSTSGSMTHPSAPSVDAASIAANFTCSPWQPNVRRCMSIRAI